MELVAGFAKIPVIDLKARRRAILVALVSFFAFIEVALCITVGALSLRNVKNSLDGVTSWSDLDRSLAGKLFIFLMVSDVLMAMIDHYILLAYFWSESRAGMVRSGRSKLFSWVAMASVFLLLVPLAVQFLRTSDRSALDFTDTTERQLVALLLVLSNCALLFAYLTRCMRKKRGCTCGLDRSMDADVGLWKLGVLTILPLVLTAFSGIAIYGAIVGDKAALLYALLVVVPSFATLTLTYWKLFLLLRYGDPIEEDDNEETEGPGEDGTSDSVNSGSAGSGV